ncbi:MAG: cyclic nucleotide-binding domain-containing protein [Desulfovibrio sp.]|nr:MAG: cyclic nucleotide-binding domain-containing protein [Desulfovibrio sp.]
MADQPVYTNNVVMDLLKRIPMLSSFTSEELRRMVYSGQFIRLERYSKGDELMREGETGTWVYILLKGGVKVIKGGAEICTLRQQGDIVGEMGPLTDKPRSATVKACRYTVCIAVNMGAVKNLPKEERADFLQRMQEVLLPLVNKRLQATEEAMELLDSIRKKKQELHHLRQRLNALGVNEEKSTLDLILEGLE